MKVWIACAPDHIRAIYGTWDDCKAATTGVKGARHQSVASYERAKAMLDGPGVVMPRGRYVFTDGNKQGGVGVVHVEQGLQDALRVRCTGTSVHEIFRDVGLPGLESPRAVGEELRLRGNILAEIAGAYHAVRLAPEGSAFTLVYDFVGVGLWLERGSAFTMVREYMGVSAIPAKPWRRDGGPTIDAVVKACQRLGRERELKVALQYQPGHQKTKCGLDDFARWNTLADQLAREGATAEQDCLSPD